MKAFKFKVTSANGGPHVLKVPANSESEALRKAAAIATTGEKNKRAKVHLVGRTEL
jgi:hypothetical protein